MRIEWNVLRVWQCASFLQLHLDPSFVQADACGEPDEHCLPEGTGMDVHAAYVMLERYVRVWGFAEYLNFSFGM